MNKKFAIALATAGVGLIAAQVLVLRDKEAKRQKHFEEILAANEKLDKAFSSFIEDVQKRLDNLEFWNIVSEDKK